MDIDFSDAELARVCNTEAARRERFGPAAAATLLRRLHQMAAAANLSDLRLLAAARIRQCSEQDLFGRRIALGHHDHLTVHPRSTPPPVMDDGTLNEFAIRALTVTSINISR